MNQKAFEAQWDQMRQKIGIAIRAVEKLPEDQLDAHPIPKMRSPKELVYHQFATLREIVEGLARGEVRDTNDADASKIRTKAELVKFCNDCWAAANRAAKTVTDEKLHATVKTPWGRDLPGFAVASVFSDEFLHHRGQLYAYLRALGADVPMMWDFGNNAEEFRPAMAAKA